MRLHQPSGPSRLARAPGSMGRGPYCRSMSDRRRQGTSPIKSSCHIKFATLQGLLLQHPGKVENNWTYPCVWLRPSRIKIKHSDSFMHHPAHCIIDVLVGTHMQSPIHISREMITNLGENGVPHAIFAELFCNSLSSVIDSLLDWDGQDAMPRLWEAVFKKWRVMAGRIARESPWTARARGVQQYDREDDNEDEEAEDADSLLGSTSSLEETVLSFWTLVFIPHLTQFLLKSYIFWPRMRSSPAWASIG